MYAFGEVELDLNRDFISWFFTTEDLKSRVGRKHLNDNFQNCALMDYCRYFSLHGRLGLAQGFSLQRGPACLLAKP